MSEIKLKIHETAEGKRVIPAIEIDGKTTIIPNILKDSINMNFNSQTLKAGFAVINVDLIVKTKEFTPEVLDALFPQKKTKF